MKIVATAERNTVTKETDNVILHRHLIAYKEAAKLVSGNVLEIGCGEGYGMEYLAPKAEAYFAIDKFNTQIDEDLKKQYNISFRQMSVPPLDGFADNSMDYIVTFQVIEHIKTDNYFLREIKRVLKPGGRLIMTTPNITMSLTRNPWHIREYTTKEMTTLTSDVFKEYNIKGVFGNEKVMKYYEENKASVAKITKFDVLKLQYRLPRWALQIPYDVMNRVNRNRLMKENTGLVKDVVTEDFFLEEANEKCFDFFVIAQKGELF